MATQILDHPLRPALEEPEPARRFRAWRKLRRHKPALIGGVVVLLFIVAAIFAPVLAPGDPTATNWLSVRKPPSAQFWFGTDDLGRDILSRSIHGGRLSLFIGLSVVVFTGVFGTLIGAVSV